MSRPNKGETKEKILRTAARMFSERGFDRVTVREIAKDVGITSGSLYNHFVSKDEILKDLYRFYSEQRLVDYPDLGGLLKMAETDPPHDVLMQTVFYYKEDVRDLLDQILATVSRLLCSDDENKNFIKENIFDSISNVLKPLLERMVELGKIKPININTFLRVLSYYCFGVAALNISPFKQSISEFQAGMAFIFSAIVPIED
jgi:AcrR family transcriptional regulator